MVFHRVRLTVITVPTLALERDGWIGSHKTILSHNEVVYNERLGFFSLLLILPSKKREKSTKLKFEGGLGGWFFFFLGLLLLDSSSYPLSLKLFFMNCDFYIRILSDKRYMNIKRTRNNSKVVGTI